MTQNSKDYWEKYLKNWIAIKFRDAESNNFLSDIAHRKAPLHERNHKFQKLMTPHISNKCVIDIGCGGGNIAPFLIKAGAKSYIGYDQVSYVKELVAQVAAQYNMLAQINAHMCCVADLEKTHITGDIVISLGIFHHLTQQEIEHFFHIIYPKPFVVAGTFWYWGLRPMRMYLSSLTKKGHLYRVHTIETINKKARKIGYKNLHFYENLIGSKRMIISSICLL